MKTTKQIEITVAETSEIVSATVIDGRDEFVVTYDAFRVAILGRAVVCGTIAYETIYVTTREKDRHNMVPLAMKVLEDLADGLDEDEIETRMHFSHLLRLEHAAQFRKLLAA